MLINSLLLIIFILRSDAYCPHSYTHIPPICVCISFVHACACLRTCSNIQIVRTDGPPLIYRCAYQYFPLNFSPYACPSIEVFALNMNLKLGALIDSCLYVISQPLELGQFWFMASPPLYRSEINKQNRHAIFVCATPCLSWLIKLTESQKYIKFFSFLFTLCQ